MGHTNDRSTKASSLVNPTSLNLQPRPFAPLESDEKEEAVSRKSGYPENFLEKIINTPSSESATPVQRKSGNRLKAITTERTNTAIQNQPIQRQEAVEEEKSEGEQEEGKEFTMNPEPPPVQRKFENRLRAKNAQRMAIQAKLAIGEPNDKYEQEADATAARVVQQINSPTTSQSQPVQRKFENRLRAKNAQRMEIQAKLAIGEPNDKYELEADATAARVVQQINSSITSQSQPVQRQELEEDEELQMKPLVQRSENLGGDEASTDLESAIQSARGSGQSLDANLQESMGQAMGADFSGVKVHTDSQSDQLNKSIQAKAFTTGQDLFFRQGAYEPSSRGGQELIAHELTHVVQQNGGAVQRQAEKQIAQLGKSEIHPLQDSPSEKNGAEELIQRLQWSEVYSGKSKEVGISDKQMPEGVEAVTGENETQDRRVFAGQTKKGRSGFLWHKESTLEIQYDIYSMQQYKIIDPDTIFYTAVRDTALEPIKKLGIDPNFGNAEQPDGATEYNVRGFNYFGKDQKTPKLYGSYLAPAKCTILSFKLPEGTLIERDPEIPNGLRTTYHIKPADIL
jgi:hypothetical protein